MSRYTLHHGDSREILKTLPDASVDSICCDPPYHLTTGKKGGTGPASVNLNTPQGRARVTTGFMGMTWDGGDVANQPEIWAECLRVAKPGAWLLAFGGTRTFHRMACAIEDAGWELRDNILRGHMPQPEDCPWLLAWGQGQGFPKATDKAKIPPEWQGFNTALKPSWEPIVCARAPMAGTLWDNLVAHGTGALNIDACRIQVQDDDYARNCSGDRGHAGTRDNDETGATNIRAGGGTAAVGRWPANIILDGSDEVTSLFPHSTSGAMKAGTVRAAQDEPGSVCYGTLGGNATDSEILSSAGSAARFFYAAKASQEDREEGISGTKKLFGMSGAAAAAAARGEHYDNGDGGVNKTTLRRNVHPTVKPTDLMRWLCRLVTPPGGLVLDPFMGSGSTGKAAMLEGFNFIGVDMTAEYVEIARARIEFALRQGHQPSLLEAIEA